ncbi:MAG TPA: hypothetical protein PLD88_00910, partial [Candidatus Berkiella sp.]|nr:hypothetical protein [Candidatus Berkiella sp.]
MHYFIITLAASTTGAYAFYGLGLAVLLVVGVTLLAGAVSYFTARVYALIALLLISLIILKGMKQLL